MLLDSKFCTKLIWLGIINLNQSNVLYGRDINLDKSLHVFYTTSVDFVPLPMVEIEHLNIPSDAILDSPVWELYEYMCDIIGQSFTKELVKNRLIIVKYNCSEEKLIKLENILLDSLKEEMALEVRKWVSSDYADNLELVPKTMNKVSDVFFPSNRDLEHSRRFIRLTS